MDNSIGLISYIMKSLFLFFKIMSLLILDVPIIYTVYIFF